jgi:flagellar biosynthetic protein FlhB
MADDQDQEKTEEATQTRKEDFRRRGQVPQSRELASALFLLMGAGAIVLLSKFFLGQMHEIFDYTLGSGLVAAVRGGDIYTAMTMSGIKLMYLLLPILGIALVVGVGSTLVQTGIMNVEDALTPKLEKINPLDGLKRLFSLRNLAEGIKAVIKVVLITCVALMIIKSEIIKVPGMMQISVEQLVTFMGDLTVRLLAGVGIAMLALSAADFFFQRWDIDKKMMMTKQEVKEDHKQREGDPLIKARIRRVQRDMANRRMMEKVPQADVIITNPTHIAVALKYSAELPAPQVIAKGADLIAEKIKSLAREHNIPIVENKPLARTIFKTLKIGSVIPRELFVAVAEVLSYVYKLRRKVKRY